MRLFFIILFVIAGLPAVAGAQAQEESLYDTFTKLCPYRAAVNRKSIALKLETKENLEAKLKSLPVEVWNKMIDSCKGDEARMPTPPRAPADTLAAEPSGEPRKIVKRPANAPMGEFYRCNAETLLPDAKSSRICGPVRPRQ